MGHGARGPWADEFRRLIRSELQRYGRLVRDARITVE